MKSKLCNFYSNYFKNQRKFTKRYFPAKYQKGVNRYTSNKTKYLAGSKLYKKTIKFLESKKIKVFYAETRNNSSIRPDDFIEYAHLLVYINGYPCALEIHTGGELIFLIYVGSSVEYGDVKWSELVNVGMSIENDSFRFDLHQGDDDYQQQLVHPEIADVLNEIRYNDKISPEQMFQYSLLDKNMEMYIECTKIMKYLYNEYKRTGVINAFTLYNI